MRLDYFSSVLTVLSMYLVGRNDWLGWIFAAVNSVIICVIAKETAQYGLIPANIICIGLYAKNTIKWMEEE